jgi:hypothetical protein
MRKVAAGVLAVVIVALAAGATTAGGDNPPQQTWPFHDGVDALKVLKKNVGGALELERSAEALAKAGKEREARDELQNSLQLLDASEDAADWMTDPFREANDPWSTFSGKLTHVIELDKIAREHVPFRSLPGDSIVPYIQQAIIAKTAVYKLVAHELSAVSCGVLTDDRGPIMVNGVAQTEEQVTVEVSCKDKIKDIKIEFPSTTVTQAQPDSGANTTLQNGKVIDEKPPAGAKTDGETMITQDPVTGERVEIVIIHGDSVDYFDDVM